MKHLIILALLSLFISSCQSNEDKARKMAADYLKSEIIHYDTYESVKISIDSLYYPSRDYQEMTKRYFDTNQRINKLKKELLAYTIMSPALNSLSEKYDRATSKNNNENHISQVTNEIKQITANFFDYITENAPKFEEKHFSGWIVTHKFKCVDENTSELAFKEKEYVFICDKNFNNCYGLDKTQYEEIAQIITTLKHISDNEPEKYEELRKTLIKESDKMTTLPAAANLQL